MCTASFRMPIEDVGRLLDTLDDGYAEITGEQPAIQDVAQPGEYPGTGQYNRPPQGVPPFPQVDERPTAAMPTSDVLVARGVPTPPDKLVASYGETIQPREAPVPQYGEPSRPQPVYGGQQQPHYPEPSYGAQPQYGEPPRHDPAYGAPRYAEPMAPGGAEPVYQLPSEPRHQRPMMTDPLGLPAQPQTRQPQPQPQPQAPLQPQAPSAAGLGTPMHGIPGAGRRSQPQDTYQQPQGGYQNPVDPLMSMGQPQDDYYQDPNLSRPYVGDQMFVTGERLRPDQRDDTGERREW